MIKTIIILVLLSISLLIFLYPKKQCGCTKKRNNNKLVKNGDKYILKTNNSEIQFDNYSDYLKHYYYNKKDEHPLPLMDSNIVSKAFPSLVEGFENNPVPSEESVPSEEAIPSEEVIIAEEEESNIDTLREKQVYKIITKYISNNPECVLKKNQEAFNIALENYMVLLTVKLIGYDKFEDMKGLSELSDNDFEKLLDLLSQMPKCEQLLEKYGKKSVSKKSIIKKDKIKKNTKPSKDSQNISTQITEATSDKQVKSTIISSKSEGNIPTITTIINTNRGTVKENPHGDRRLEPSKAPYLMYFNQISKKLSELSIKLDSVPGVDSTQKSQAIAGDEVNNKLSSISDAGKQVQDSKNIAQQQVQQSENQNSEQQSDKNVDLKKDTTQNKVDNSKYIKQEQTIKNNLQDQKVQLENTISSSKITKQQEAEKRVDNANQKLYVNAGNTENKMFNDKENVQEAGANFNFKPNVKFDHKQPSRKIMSAYGWSYMPPQAWSVPQKRPPVCIPDKNTQATVTPIYDKGTPVDAMSWTQANNLLPKTEYTEEYNANYYYPGWIAQDGLKYPLDKAGNFRGGEYYNYNLAKKVEQ